MNKILVVGSSHVAAIQAAARGIDGIECYWVKNSRRDNPPGDIVENEALAMVETLNKSDVLAITWRGTIHHMIGLVQHEQPFDFCYGKDGTADASREIIPNAVIKAHFEQQTRRDEFTKALVRSTKARIFILATPPSKGHDEILRDRIKKYRGMDLLSMGVTPANIRAKLWSLEMDALAWFSRRIGVGYLPAPDEALDDLGYLKMDLWASDATHANQAYGALVVKQLQQIATVSPSPKMSRPEQLS